MAVKLTGRRGDSYESFSPLHRARAEGQALNTVRAWWRWKTGDFEGDVAAIAQFPSRSPCDSTRKTVRSGMPNEEEYHEIILSRSSDGKTLPLPEGSALPRRVGRLLRSPHFDQLTWAEYQDMLTMLGDKNQPQAPRASSTRRSPAEEPFRSTP